MSNPSWTPNTPVGNGKVILDPNGNIQQWTAAAGTTGAIPPNWSDALGAFTADGTGGWTLVIYLEAVTLPTGVITLPAPTFVNDNDGLDPNLLFNDLVNNFQNLAGRTLYPAQVENLLLYVMTYAVSLVRDAIQYAAQQNLLAYATFPILDYLGQLVGVTRLPAVGANTTLQFTLVAAQPIAVEIPAGTLIGTSDGQFQFATQSLLTIPAGATSGLANAICTTPSANANGYAVGALSVQFNPNLLISAVGNTTVTMNGGTAETDAHLRSRIQAAPNQYSVAGPSGAYRFFALGANPSIIDASVVTPAPGQVSVYVLTGPIVQPAAAPNLPAAASSTILAAVQAAISGVTVRPLCDTPTALAVSEIDYVITATLTLYADADSIATPALAQAAAAQFATALASRIQRDIVPSQIIEALSVAGVYEVTLAAPNYQQLTPGQWANCTAINLTTVVGSENT